MKHINKGLLGILCALVFTGCGEYWREGYADAYVVDDYTYVDTVDVSSTHPNKTLFTFQWQEDHVGDVDVAVITGNGVKISPQTPVGDGCRLLTTNSGVSGENEVQIECDATCKGNFKLSVANQCSTTAEVKYIVETFDRYGSSTVVDCATLWVNGSQEKLVSIVF